MAPSPTSSRLMRTLRFRLRSGSSATHAGIVLAWVACVGCREGGTAERSFFDPDTPPPEITEISMDCDLDANRFRFEVVTNAWAGGATLLWSEDGDYVEQHGNFRSIRAGELGLRDELRADITMVDDFRAAGSGGSTAFTCRAEPSALLWVTGLDGEISDCRHFGPEPELLFELEDSPLCTDVWTF